jgi:dTDP-4-amino-4,6-dideoxygalactose transaminase
MITTNDDHVAQVARCLRNHGLDPDASTPDFVVPGYNLRLTEMQGALGLSQMAKIDRLIAARVRSAEFYNSILEGSGVQLPRSLPGSRHVYQSYVVLLPDRLAAKRDSIIARMRASGIEVTIGTYHMPLTTYFRRAGSWNRGTYPVTDSVAGRAISLPLSAVLTEEHQEQVAQQLREAMRIDAC